MNIVKTGILDFGGAGASVGEYFYMPSSQWIDTLGVTDMNICVEVFQISAATTVEIQTVDNLNCSEWTTLGDPFDEQGVTTFSAYSRKTLTDDNQFGRFLRFKVGTSEDDSWTCCFRISFEPRA